MFWSLTAGQSILAHHALFGVNAFTYTEPHRRWVADEWGSEVVLASLYKVFGSWAFNLFAIGTGTLSLVCTRAYVRALGARGVRVAVITVLLAIGIFSVITQDRGLSFSLIWVPLELLLLTKARQNPRWLLGLLPLFVCWVNTHGSILLVLLIIGIEWAWSLAPQRLVDTLGGTGRSTFPRQLGLAAVGALVASCLSPYGPALLRYDLGVSLNSQIGQYIEEWASPDFHSIPVLVTFCVPLVVLVLAFRSRRLALLEASMTIMLALATLHATRFVVYLFIAACGLAATLPVRRAWSPRGRRVMGALGISAMIILLAAPSVPAGSVTSDTPVAAFNYLSAHPGRVFTEYAWGDYSILRHRDTFADGRTDYFSGNVLTEFFDVTNLTVNPDAVLSRYDVSYVVWKLDSPLGLYLRTTRAGRSWIAPARPWSSPGGNASAQGLAPGRQVEARIARLDAGQGVVVPVGMARLGKAEDRELAGRGLLDELAQLGGEAPEGPRLVAAPDGSAGPERDVEHDPLPGGMVDIDRAVVHVGAVGHGGAGRGRRHAHVVVEIAVLHIVQGVPLHRDAGGTTPGHETGGPVLEADVGEVDEEFELLEAHVVPGHHQHVVRIVGVEQLVIARRLVGVLGGDDAHIEGNVGGPEERFGQGDDPFMEDEGIKPGAVERELGPLGVPCPPERKLVVMSVRHFLRGGKEQRDRTLRIGQRRGGNGALYDAPTVGIPLRFERGSQEGSGHAVRVVLASASMMGAGCAPRASGPVRNILFE